MSSRVFLTEFSISYKDFFVHNVIGILSIFLVILDCSLYNISICAIYIFRSLKTRLSNWRSHLTSSLCFLPKYTLKGHFYPSSSLFSLFKHAMYCGRYRDQLTPALCWLAKLSVRPFNLNSSLQIVRLFFIWILIF